MGKVKGPIRFGSKMLYDAQGVAEYFGWSANYVNQLAAKGKIPWHGIEGGMRVYRRFDLEEVKVALAHGVAAPKSIESELAETSRQRTA
jgi:hypothetical protein